MLLLVLTQDKAQPVLLDAVATVFGPFPLAAKDGKPGPPGNVVQFVDVWTPPSIWTPIAIMIANPIKDPAKTVIVLASIKQKF